MRQHLAITKVFETISNVYRASNRRVRQMAESTWIATLIILDDNSAAIKQRDTVGGGMGLQATAAG